jgi:hypothetical protein
MASNNLSDFTATLSGLIGSSHCEYKFTCSNVRNATASHQDKIDAKLTSLSHTTAARARIRSLVDFNSKSTLTPTEVQEVASLSCDFFLPSPYTRFVANVNGGKVEGTEEEKKIRSGGACSGGYIPSKLLYKVPLRPALDVAGVAINADAAQSEESQRERKTLAGLSNAEFCAKIVGQVVNVVCASEADAESLLVDQKDDGSFCSTSQTFLAAVGISAEQFAARKPTWADDETWATAVGIVAAEKLGGQVAQLALRKAELFIASRNGGETVNAARRTLM